MNIYFPIVMNQKDAAAEFWKLLSQDSRQQRLRLEWSDKLAKAAAIRTESLARLNYWAHCEPNGPCPNPVARSVGCVFPKDYSENGNNIESLVAGTPNVEVAYMALINSPSHHDHIVGLGPFFQRQTHCGIHVRYDPNSRFKWYYSVLIAELL